MVGCAQQSLAPTKVRPKKLCIYIYIYYNLQIYTTMYIKVLLQNNFTFDITLRRM